MILKLHCIFEVLIAEVLYEIKFVIIFFFYKKMFSLSRHIRCIIISLQMTSLDRIKEICDVPTEADIITTLRPGDTWPQYGIVTFEGVSLAVDGDVRNMLKNVWGCIRAEEKVCAF